MNKKCKGCDKIKPVEMFSMAGKYYQSKCKECLKLVSRKWRIDNPERVRYTQARSKLKINDKEYGRISLIDRCEICGAKTKSLHIDHNHQTGVFRGALCGNCNLGLGKLKDSKENLIKAILYLERYDN